MKPPRLTPCPELTALLADLATKFERGEITQVQGRQAVRAFARDQKAAAPRRVALTATEARACYAAAR